MIRQFNKKQSISVAAAFLIISILLMFVVMPGVYNGTIPDAKNSGAIIGISLAIMIRMLILNEFRTIVKKIRENIEVRKKKYFILGAIILFFGLFYSNGAFAFSNDKNVAYVSYLMFTSVLFDTLAAIMIFLTPWVVDKKGD